MPSLRAVVEDAVTQESLDYDAVYSGSSDWRILPAMDHPAEPARCLVSGTGLTHLASAKNRDAMHAAPGAILALTQAPTDSMRMYQLGVEGGRAAPGEIGAAPEWFYKGNGTTLRAHGEPLDVPPHAEDGGEEPEIAGVYVIDAQWRAAARWHGARQRIFRSPLREAQLSEPGVVEVDDLRHRSGTGRGLRSSAPSPAKYRLSATARFSGVSRSAVEMRRCRTAWRIWSIITSSMPVTGVPATSTYTSSAPAHSASARASRCEMGT